MRYSRHYYDLYRMGLTDVRRSSLLKPDLLTTVASFKSKFYPCTWARYEEARPGTLKLIPPEHVLSGLRTDYRNMRDMVFGHYPAFDEIMEGLASLEAEINATL